MTKRLFSLGNPCQKNELHVKEEQKQIRATVKNVENGRMPSDPNLPKKKMEKSLKMNESETIKEMNLEEKKKEISKTKLNKNEKDSSESDNSSCSNSISNGKSKAKVDSNANSHGKQSHPLSKLKFCHSNIETILPPQQNYHHNSIHLNANTEANLLQNSAVLKNFHNLKDDVYSESSNPNNVQSSTFSPLQTFKGRKTSSPKDSFPPKGSKSVLVQHQYEFDSMCDSNPNSHGANHYPFPAQRKLSKSQNNFTNNQKNDGSKSRERSRESSSSISRDSGKSKSSVSEHEPNFETLSQSDSENSFSQKNKESEGNRKANQPEKKKKNMVKFQNQEKDTSPIFGSESKHPTYNPSICLCFLKFILLKGKIKLILKAMQ